MYREPHLQKKSDECSVLWWEWYHAWRNGDKDHQVKRDAWNKCTDKFAEMIRQEVKTNPRYRDVRM